MSTPAYPQTADPALTGMFADLGAKDFFLPQVAPIREVDGMTGTYPKLVQSDRATQEGAETPYSLTPNATPTSAPKPIPFALGEGTFNLKIDKRSVEVSDASKLQWAATYGIEVDRPALASLRRFTDGVVDKYGFGVLGTSGNYSGQTADPGNFNTTTTSLQKPLLVGAKAIRDAVGRMPNVAFCNRTVAHQLLEVDDVQNSLALGAQAQIAGLDALATWFANHIKVRLVIVDTTYKATAGTVTEVFGNHIGLAYVSDAAEEPSFCNLMTNRQFGSGMGTAPSTAGIKEVRDERRDLTEYIASIAFDCEIVTAGAGYLLTDVLS